MGFKSRLITERSELNEKVDKLNDFLQSDKKENIDDFQLAMLYIQIEAMSAYLQCLNVRIMKL